jgi:autotransporter strand-loop-strand O-heptosyltransferase
MKITVKYVCTLPKIGNTPSVTLHCGNAEKYYIKLIDNDTDTIVCTKGCCNGETIIGERQWYTNWRVEVWDGSATKIHTEYFNPDGKVVFIKTDSFALGDNIAWVPYFDEFRKKHNCTVICSTFFNELFENVYPELLFVKPNTIISNVYAQYYVGASNDGNIKYCPSNYKDISLQRVASSILGLPDKEIVPRVVIRKSQIANCNKEYICISEFASASNKMWQYDGGWQHVVDYINEMGYEVRVISKEPTELKNVVNLTGNFSLDERITQLSRAKLFIGVSSGLGWLSWAVGTHVMMISDISPQWHEFQSGITRLSNNKTNCVDYSPTEPTSCEKVLKELSILLG